MTIRTGPATACLQQSKRASLFTSRRLAARSFALGLLLLVAGASCRRTPKAGTSPDAPTPPRAAADATPEATAPSESITFTEHIAPLVWEKCAPCHRPGEAAPFALLSFADLQKRAQQIVEVTQSQYMPPWLAETTSYALVDDARLTAEEQQLLALWVEQGTPEGLQDKLPPMPTWPAGWNLGAPDLEVRMEQPFELPAEGTDVYRNFVIPVPLTRPRYVRAMEFRPGNHRIVHHAFIMLDPTRRLRRVQEADGQPGFAGMETQGAEPPDGHFIGWQPGRRPYEAPEGMSWRIYPGTDLVVQVHMQPTGKPEALQAAVGLYFTDEPPKWRPTKIGLRSIDIDIPAGEANYPVRDEFELPVDLEVLAVAPHAHYLGREMYGKAILPSGETKTLFAIRNWDPNWQREYRYAAPISLPAGTKLVQEFVYDNSEGNVRNPFHPPQRVTYGLRATDEMGSLWFQVLPQNATDRVKLDRALVAKSLEESTRRFTAALRKNRQDTHALIEMGKIGLVTGSLPTARNFFAQAVAADATSADAHYYLGQTLLRLREAALGRQHLERVLAIDSRYEKAYHDLGWADYLAGDYAGAEARFDQALAIRPYDANVLDKLGRTKLRLGKPQEARQCFEQALSIAPDNDDLRRRVESLQAP